jgi:hypothetical protein
VAAGYPARPYIPPEVRKGALGEATPADSVENVRRAHALRHKCDRVGRDRRQNDSSRQAILRRLLAPGAVDAPLNHDLERLEIDIGPPQGA